MNENIYPQISQISQIFLSAFSASPRFIFEEGMIGWFKKL